MIRESGTIGPSVRDLGVKERKPLTGRAYRKHFDGYSVIELPKPGGQGTRHEYVYTADYYRRDLSERGRLRLKAAYLLACAAAVLLFLSNVTDYSAGNMTWYVTLPQAVCTATLGWLALSCARVVAARRDQTIAEHRLSSVAFRRASRAASVALAAQAAVMVAFALLSARSELLRELIHAVRYAACALLAHAVCTAECNAPYLRVPSAGRIPENARVVKRIGEADRQATA